jgi:hypothetical protein
LALTWIGRLTVRGNGRFFDCEVVDYKETEYSFEPPAEEELARYQILQPQVQKTAQFGNAGIKGESVESPRGSES